MREIKFRAWDKENKKMVHSDEVFPRSNYKFEFDCFNDYEFRLMKMINRYNVIDDKGNERYQEVFKSVDADIMKYTGIKDEKGNEIYEGDIIKIKAFKVNEKEVSIAKVIYSEFEGMYITSKGHILGRINDRVEVIGNIYENKDLLGKSCEQ